MPSSLVGRGILRVTLSEAILNFVVVQIIKFCQFYNVMIVYITVWLLMRFVLFICAKKGQEISSLKLVELDA